MSRYRQFRYRSASRLVTLLTLLLIVDIVLGFVSAGSDWIEIRLLTDLREGLEVDQERLDQTDLRQMIIALIQMAQFLVTATIFALWIIRTNKNAHVLANRDLEHSPGWSVGWYFVPFANLVKPYQAMKEIWTASTVPRREDDLADPSGPGSSILVWWWGLWLLANGLGQVSFRMTLRADTIDEVLQASWIMLASDVLDIPLALVTMMLVLGLQARQEEASLTRDHSPPEVALAADLAEA